MSVAAMLAVAAALLVAPGPARPATRLNPRTRNVGSWRRPPSFAPDPLAAAASYDLLAACLHAGMSVPAAAAAVASQAPPVLAGALGQAANLLVLGAEPDAAWSEAARNPETESLARTVRRSARSGTAVATAVAGLAAERRAEVEDGAAAAAERAGVLVSGPLGLCFLPAFLCLGIAPVVIGLAGRVLGEGLL